MYPLSDLFSINSTFCDYIIHKALLFILCVPQSIIASFQSPLDRRPFPACYQVQQPESEIGEYHAALTCSVSHPPLGLFAQNDFLLLSPCHIFSRCRRLKTKTKRNIATSTELVVWDLCREFVKWRALGFLLLLGQLQSLLPPAPQRVPLQTQRVSRSWVTLTEILPVGYEGEMQFM